MTAFIWCWLLGCWLSHAADVYQSPRESIVFHDPAASASVNSDVDTSERESSERSEADGLDQLFSSIVEISNPSSKTSAKMDSPADELPHDSRILSDLYDYTDLVLSTFGDVPSFQSTAPDPTDIPVSPHIADTTLYQTRTIPKLHNTVSLYEKTLLYLEGSFSEFVSLPSFTATPSYVDGRTSMTVSTPRNELPLLLILPDDTPTVVTLTSVFLPDGDFASITVNDDEVSSSLTESTYFTARFGVALSDLNRVNNLPSVVDSLDYDGLASPILELSSRKQVVDNTDDERQEEEEAGKLHSFLQSSVQITTISPDTHLDQTNTPYLSLSTLVDTTASKSSFINPMEGDDFPINSDRVELLYQPESTILYENLATEDFNPSSPSTVDPISPNFPLTDTIHNEGEVDIQTSTFILHSDVYSSESTSNTKLRSLTSNTVESSKSLSTSLILPEIPETTYIIHVNNHRRVNTNSPESIKLRPKPIMSEILEKPTIEDSILEEDRKSSLELLTVNQSLTPEPIAMNQSLTPEPIAMNQSLTSDSISIIQSPISELTSMNKSLTPDLNTIIQSSSPQPIKIIQSLTPEPIEIAQSLRSMLISTNESLTPERTTIIQSLPPENYEMSQDFSPEVLRVEQSEVTSDSPTDFPPLKTSSETPQLINIVPSPTVVEPLSSPQLYLEENSQGSIKKESLEAPPFSHNPTSIAENLTLVDHETRSEFALEEDSSEFYEREKLDSLASLMADLKPVVSEISGSLEDNQRDVKELHATIDESIRDTETIPQLANVPPVIPRDSSPDFRSESTTPPTGDFSLLSVRENTTVYTTRESSVTPQPVPATIDGTLTLSQSDSKDQFAAPEDPHSDQASLNGSTTQFPSSNKTSRNDNPTLNAIINDLIVLLSQDSLVSRPPGHFQIAPSGIRIIRPTSTITTRINNRGPGKFSPTQTSISRPQTTTEQRPAEVTRHTTDATFPSVSESSQILSLDSVSLEHSTTEESILDSSMDLFNDTTLPSTIDSGKLRETGQTTPLTQPEMNKALSFDTEPEVSSKPPEQTDPLPVPVEITAPSNGTVSLVSSVETPPVTLSTSWSIESQHDSNTPTSALQPTSRSATTVPTSSTSTGTSDHDPFADPALPTGPITDWVPIFHPPSFRFRPSPSSSSATEELNIITEPTIFDVTVVNAVGSFSSSVRVTDPTIVKIAGVNIVTSDRLPSTEIETPVSSSSVSPSTHPQGEVLVISPTLSVPVVLPTTSRTLYTPSSSEPEIVYGRPPVSPVPPPPVVDSTTRPPDRNRTTSAHPPRRHPTLSATRRPPSKVTQGEDIETIVASATLKQRGTTATRYSRPPTGRPIVIPVDIDEVRPFISPLQPPPPRSGQPPKGGARPPGSPVQIATAGVNLADDNQPSFQGGRPSPPLVRVPSRTRPNVPLVRIDTCIVGDASTCDSKLNERCKSEQGVSTCQCRPGYARSASRGPCQPVVSVAMSLKIDRIGDQKLTFNPTYLNRETEEYRLMEYETKQALASLFSYTGFGRVFVGVNVNKFYPMGNKLVVNATVQLEEHERTTKPSMRQKLRQEVIQSIAKRHHNIGESRLYVDTPLSAVPLVDDINECGTLTTNDCSENAVCQNTFGAFQCTCKPGFMDKYPGDRKRSGRICTVCSPDYCNKHGVCVIEDGQRICKCRGNYIGSRCEMDSEVLGVALGASLAAVIIIILTLACLCIWNRRWKREQHKSEVMSARSAGSGQTFSYLNKVVTPANTYRLTIEDRMRWAHIADAMGNVYVQPDPVAANQPTYANTPRAHLSAGDPSMNRARIRQAHSPVQKGAGYLDMEYSAPYPTTSRYLTPGVLRPFYS